MVCADKPNQVNTKKRSEIRILKIAGSPRIDFDSRVASRSIRDARVIRIADGRTDGRTDGRDGRERDSREEGFR